MKESKSISLLFFSKYLFFVITCFYTEVSFAQWGFSIGGEGIEQSYDMVTGSSGNIYITGNFQDNTMDFDPGTGQVLLNSVGGSDIFLACYSDGGILNWAKSVGGTKDETVYGIDIDLSGNIYLIGSFNSEEADFDPGNGTHIISRSSYGDNSSGMFLASYKPNGDFRWAFAISPTLNSLGGKIVGYSVHVDKNLNVWTTGTIFCKEADFDPGNGEHILAGVVDWDAYQYKINTFIAKYSSEGDFLWAEEIGKKTTDVSGQNITSDKDGDIYLCGYLVGSGIDFNPSVEVHELSSNGSVDAFVMKLDNSGNFKWAYNFGGSGVDLASSIVVNNDTLIHLIGYYEGTVDFDPSAGNSTYTSLGSKDIFIANYHTNGSFLQSASLGSLGEDRALKVNNDNSGNLTITGYYMNANNDFDPGSGTLLLPHVNGRGMFYGSLTSSLELLWMRGVSMQGNINGIEMLSYENGYLLLGEISGGNVDIDAGPNVIEILGCADNEQNLFLAYYQNPTSIKEMAKTDNELFRIFPNPFSNYISIDVLKGNESDMIAKVFDLQGKLIFQSLGEINSLTNEINKEINKWNNGLYLFSLKINKTVFTQLIMKSSD